MIFAPNRPWKRGPFVRAVDTDRNYYGICATPQAGPLAEHCAQHLTVTFLADVGGPPTLYLEIPHSHAHLNHKGWPWQRVTYLQMGRAVARQRDARRARRAYRSEQWL